MDEKLVKMVDTIAKRVDNRFLNFARERDGSLETSCVIDIELNEKTASRLSKILD